MKIQLVQLAHARSGDKGDTANIGLIALKPEYYEILKKEVSPERVKEHFKGICEGKVERFELPNIELFIITVSWQSFCKDIPTPILLRIISLSRIYESETLINIIEVHQTP